MTFYFPLKSSSGKKKTELLRQLTEGDLLHCFIKGKTRVQRCEVAEGEDTEGEENLNTESVSYIIVAPCTTF